MLKKTDKYITISAVCMLTLSACSSDDALSVADKDGGGKTPIELTVGITGQSPSATRATTRTVVTTDKKDKNNAYMAQAFGANTNLYMVMESKKDASNIKYTRTIGTAAAVETPTAGSSSDVSFTGNNIRYWEDSYSRDSKLSIYSICVPGGSSDGINTALSTWATVDTDNSQWDTKEKNGSTTIAWPLNGVSVASQDATNFIASQDLCFSNNVSELAGGNGPLKFNDTEKKFTSGRMVFYHALTKVTFKIVHGAGFTGGDTDFKFTNSNENIVLEEFNTSGTFDITQGEFLTSPTIGTDDVNILALGASETDIDYVYNGIILPGTDLSSPSGKVHFTIDGNQYNIKKTDLKTALADKTTDKTGVPALDANNKMLPGVHYIFTLIVGKTKIEKLTAAVVDWETVEASYEPTNARITLNLLDNGTKQTNTHTAFNLYRLADNASSITDTHAEYDWLTPYETTPATLTWNGTTGNASGHWSTNWFWDDNKNYYHFRTVSPNTVTLNAKTNDTAGDYITLTADQSYTDVCWGAPFCRTTDKLYYDPTTNGFALKKESADHQISKAIGPTTGTISMQMFHMMSDVTIVLTTPTKENSTDLADNAVTLSGATVSLTNIYPTGTVLMGTGLVTPTGELNTVNGTVDNTNHKWTYGFVPQALDTSGSEVVLTITANNNKYIVNMKDMVATTVSKNVIADPYTGNGNKITRWYPNYKYTYTFKLTKTGIKDITATLTNWENVTAEAQDVVIK